MAEKKAKINVRSSKSGRYVKPEMAETNPNETVTETVIDPVEKLVSEVPESVKSLHYDKSKDVWTVEIDSPTGDVSPVELSSTVLIKFLRDL